MKVIKLNILGIILATLLISCASTNSNQTTSNELAPSISSDEAASKNLNKDKANADSDKETPAQLFINSLEGISLTFSKTPKATYINKAFNSSFDFSAKDKDGNPLVNYPITISFPSSKENGEILYSEIDIKTDKNGNYSYTAETPSFSVNTTLAVYPTPIDYSDEVIDAAVSYRAEADWKVKSDIITKGAVLFIWDFNEKNKPINNSYDILSEFRTRGMTMVGNAPVNETSYIGKPISTLYKENYEIIENAYGYLIIGTVKFSKPVEPVDDQYSCSLTADIQAVDMKNGKLIYSSIFEHEAKGKNWNACVSKAKEELATMVVDALVYGL
ncbi:MAG: hypothetical protein K6C97_11625 [Treponema sp.]|nr:hypothetical protein [Treponema sp.]